VTREIDHGIRGISSLISFTLYSILPTLVELTLVIGYLLLHYEIWFSVIVGVSLVIYIGFTFTVTNWRTRFRREVNELDALAGDESSRAYYRGHLADEKAPLPARQRALAVLVASRDRAAAPVIHRIFAEKTTPSFRRALIQALAAVGDADSPAVLLGRFGVFSPEQVNDAIAALASNAAGGKALLAAVAAGKADKALLSPLVVRQLKSLGDQDLDAQLAAVVGVVNATQADFAKNKAKYEAMLKPEAVRKGDLAAGRQLFLSTCGICHAFGYAGNQVGPGLAGSNIGKLDYFLENVLNPNGVIGKDYQLNVFKLKGGGAIKALGILILVFNFNFSFPGGVNHLSFSDFDS
jgi:mono/diheme cytochrome c family protein